MRFCQPLAILAVSALALLAGACTSSVSQADPSVADAAARLGLATPTATLAISPSDSTPQAGSTVMPPADTPAEVVNRFYGWYLNHAGLANPLVDKAYRTSADLTPDLIAQVDQIVAGPSGAGFDPFLCAQDVPETYRVGQAEMAGESARVFVGTSLQDHSFSVGLSRTGGRWRITAVQCGEAASLPQSTAEANGPERVVQSSTTGTWAMRAAAAVL
jgi:hypothetical protein